MYIERKSVGCASGWKFHVKNSTIEEGKLHIYITLEQKKLNTSHASHSHMELVGLDF